MANRVSKNAMRYLIEVANSAIIVVERDHQYGDASVRDLGMKARFMDIHRKFKRIQAQVWEGQAKIDKDMPEKSYESVLDDLKDGGNYNFLAIPVLRDEAGRKYKKSEYRQAAETFRELAAILDPEGVEKAPKKPPSKPKGKKADEKPSKKDSMTKNQKVERKLRLLDGDDIAETSFDAQVNVDGITANAAKLLLYAWADHYKLGKGDKAVIPKKSQLAPKFIAKLMSDKNSLVSDVNKECGLKDEDAFREKAEEFFQFALVELDIIEGKKASDPEAMLEKAKSDKDVIAPGAKESGMTVPND